MNFNSSFEDEDVFASLLALTRKLGKFPTTAEMRLERRTNDFFPNDKTIRARGDRRTLLKKLIEYCHQRAEYADVGKILDAISVESHSEEITEESFSLKQNGSVYLIRAQGLYKIGSTRAIYRRAAEIANQSASGVELLHHIATDDPEGIEKYWHERFSAKRVVGLNKQSGEWFDLKAEDVSTFKKRKFM